MKYITLIKHKHLPMIGGFEYILPKDHRQAGKYFERCVEEVMYRMGCTDRSLIEIETTQSK